MRKMGIDDTIDQTINNIGYYAVIGWNRIVTISSPCLKIVYKITDTILGLFTPDKYVFFEGHDIPISLKDINSFKDISSNSNIFYDLNKRYFYKNIDKKLKSLPYLSAIVKNRDAHICDLTNWISTVKYSTESVPNIRMLIMAWSLESKTLLNITNNYYTEIIDDNGENIRIDFNKSA